MAHLKDRDVLYADWYRLWHIPHRNGGMKTDEMKLKHSDKKTMV
jgi:hypothetical protein